MPRVSVLFVLFLGCCVGLREVRELWRIEDALEGNSCLTSWGGNNWGVYFDDAARQELLWAQAGAALRQWDVSNSSADCEGRPRSLPASSLVAEGSQCPRLDTGSARGSFFSTGPPGSPCGCTAGAFDRCAYRLRVSNPRCGAPVLLDFVAAAEFPLGERLRDGQTVSGPALLAMDGDAQSGSAADACSELLNAGDMAGHWCVVKAGGCDFDTKLRHCLAGEPVGMLVVASGAGTQVPGPFSQRLTVPVIQVSAEAGARLEGHYSSSVLAVSKTIGPADAPQYAAAGLRAADRRALQVHQSQVIQSSRRFLREPYRPYAWSVGVQHVQLLDVGDEREPRVLHTFEGQSWGVDWAFGSSQFRTFFFAVRRQGEIVLYDVTDPRELKELGALPAAGPFFLTRDSSLLVQAVRGEGFRFQEVWDISKPDCPVRIAQVTLDTSLLTEGGALRNPAGGNGPLVSYNLGGDGVAFFDYSDPAAPVLMAYSDVSPSDCAPEGVAGPSGRIVPSATHPNVWLVCQEHEETPAFTCVNGARASEATLCQEPREQASRRVDIYALEVMPPAKPTEDCEDGAIVNLHFLRK